MTPTAATVNSEQPQEPEQSNALPIIIVAVVVLAAAGIVAFVLYKKKK
jgi:hypothetical protein